MKKIHAVAMALMMGAGINCFAQKKYVYLSTNSKMEFEQVTQETLQVSLFRTFYAGYNTICLPFDVSAKDLKAALGDGVMLEKLVKADAQNIFFLDVTEEGIQAGMPYLLYTPERKSVKLGTTDPNLVTKPIALNVGGVTMMGKFEPTEEIGLYGIPAQQNVDILESVLVRTEGDKTFLPTRCGIKAPTCTDVPVICHVKSLNEATSLSMLQAENTKVNVYTTDGKLLKRNVRINDAMLRLKPGIYVVNGQKLVIQ